MQFEKISFGYRKNLGNGEHCELYAEAKLEAWEDPSQSLNLLRGFVAEELSLPDKWFDLKGKFLRTLETLEKTSAALAAEEEKLRKAKQSWEDFAQTLIAKGINSGLIDKNPLEAIKETINRQIDEAVNEAAEYMLPTLRREGEETAQELDTEQGLLPFSEDAVDSDGEIDADPYGYITPALDEDEADDSGLSGELEENDDYFDPYYGDDYGHVYPVYKHPNDDEIPY